MNKSTTENLSPEPQPNSEQKADETHVSPSIANAPVSSRISLTEAEINDYIKSQKDNPCFNDEKISDGWHTFEELYEFRKIYNAALFNLWALHFGNKIFETMEGVVVNPKYSVHKSWKHEDGQWCFGNEKKWFIVSAMLPTGLISNHYKAKEWDLFKVPEVEKAIFKFDGHTGSDVLTRLSGLNGC